MDYAKSGDPEIGVVIKHCEWVEGMEIRYWRSDIGDQILELGRDLTRYGKVKCGTILNLVTLGI